MAETMKPPFAPLMTAPVTEPKTTTTTPPPPKEAVAPPEPEDIEDPQVPPATRAALTESGTLPPPPPGVNYDALLQGFCQHLRDRFDGVLGQSARDAMGCIDDMHVYLKQRLEMDAEKIRHAETVLDALITKVATDGLRVRQDPYEATLGPVLDPYGFPTTIKITKADPEQLMTALPALASWMAANQYKPA